MYEDDAILYQLVAVVPLSHSSQGKGGVGWIALTLSTFHVPPKNPKVDTTQRQIYFKHSKSLHKGSPID